MNFEVETVSLFAHASGSDDLSSNSYSFRQTNYGRVPTLGSLLKPLLEESESNVSGSLAIV